MDPKDSETNNKQANINIDINGEQDQGAIKNTMNLEASQESRVGLSKDELMKFANQPFWVRLRNILFASFWIVWLSILVAAIGYVIHSPGCGPKVASAAAINVSRMAQEAAPAIVAESHRMT